jgi:mannose-6-phosphate isomerase-like protein (cupin superfamily)
MNWESRFDLTSIGKVERHNETDEVFVLLKGRSILFICDQEGIQAIDMQPGVLYNVTRATWHNVIGTRGTRWLIVESNDTSEENSDYRDLENDELAALRSQFPSWLK